MKKRKVKYNPNKPALNPVRKFQLTGEAIEENRMLDIWQLTHGKTEDDAPELDVLLQFTKGDLVVAMRKKAISRQQSFHIACVIVARHSDGREIELSYEVASPERMTYGQFLNGSDMEDGEEPIYVIESGIKSRWLGANKIMENYLHETAGPGFKIVKQPYTVTCFSAFLNLEARMNFKSALLVTMGNGLGVTV